VTECPANAADRKQSLQIYPVGVNEAMTLNYEIICDCPCERPGNPVRFEKVYINTINITNSYCNRVTYRTRPSAITAETWNAESATVTLRTVDRNVNAQPTPTLANSSRSASQTTRLTFCAATEATAYAANANVSRVQTLQKY